MSGKHGGFDQMLNSFYRQIGDQYVTDTAESIEKMREAAQEIEYPKELDDWFKAYMKQLVRAERKQQSQLYWKKQSRRLALVFLLVLLGCSIVTFGVEANRNKFFDFVTEVTEKYTTFDFDQEEQKQGNVIDGPHGWSYYFMPTYLPEGYVLGDSKVEGSIRVMRFLNKQKQALDFTQAPIGADLVIDTENAQIEEVNINDQLGSYVIYKKKVSILWKNESTVFVIHGYLPLSEMIKVAESTQFHK